MSKIRFVGLDVHADTIAIAVAEPSGEVRSFGVIANRPESVRKLMHKLGSVEQLRVCCEAGPTGYVLYWQLTALGERCEVIAPTLVPVKAGDRVKTDRRDAIKLARSYRAGDLTPVWVPDAAHEALRDLVRAREAAKRDQLRARHRLGKFLLRSGWQRPEHLKTAWSKPHLEWIRTKVHFEQPAQEATLADYVHEVEHVALRLPAQAPSGSQLRSQRNRLEGPESSASTLPKISRPWQKQTADRHRSGQRAVGFYLGHWRQSGSGTAKNRCVGLHHQ